MSYMGIDGGGSRLRVVITDADMQELVRVESSTANPSIIDIEVAQTHIITTIRKALSQFQGSIEAVSLGIAGASASHSRAWLKGISQIVLPSALCVPSSDVEIALVGAHGGGEGILLLAGTGSVALGRKSDGQLMEVGGWGYLLGDEAGGYWFGRKALNRYTQWLDGVFEPKSEIFTHLQANPMYCDRAQVIQAIYRRHGTLPVADVAKLAPMILEVAREGDELALEFVEQAKGFLVDYVNRISKKLDLSPNQVQFAGSLLTEATILRDYVSNELALDMPPIPKYEPVIGAALLAKLTLEDRNHAY